MGVSARCGELRCAHRCAWFAWVCARAGWACWVHRRGRRGPTCQRPGDRIYHGSIPRGQLLRACCEGIGVLGGKCMLACDACTRMHLMMRPPLFVLAAAPEHACAWAARTLSHTPLARAQQAGAAPSSHRASSSTAPHRPSTAARSWGGVLVHTRLRALTPRPSVRCEVCRPPRVRPPGLPLPSCRWAQGWLMADQKRGTTLVGIVHSHLSAPRMILSTSSHAAAALHAGSRPAPQQLAVQQPSSRRGRALVLHAIKEVFMPALSSTMTGGLWCGVLGLRVCACVRARRQGGSSELRTRPNALPEAQPACSPTPARSRARTHARTQRARW